MTTKNATPVATAQSATAQKTATAPKPATAEIPNVDKEKNVDALQKELAVRLEELSRKKELADKRAVFLSTDAKLKNFLQEIKAKEIEGHFEAPKFRMVFKEGDNSYHMDEVFAISTTNLIRKFIENLRAEIAEKVTEIEGELIF